MSKVFVANMLPHLFLRRVSLALTPAQAVAHATVMHLLHLFSHVTLKAVNVPASMGSTDPTAGNVLQVFGTTDPVDARVGKSVT